MNFPFYILECVFSTFERTCYDFECSFKGLERRTVSTGQCFWYFYRGFTYLVKQAGKPTGSTGRVVGVRHLWGLHWGETGQSVPRLAVSCWCNHLPMRCHPVRRWSNSHPTPCQYATIPFWTNNRSDALAPERLAAPAPAMWCRPCCRIILRFKLWFKQTVQTAAKTREKT